MPRVAAGAVASARGSDSIRHGSRNRCVAAILVRAGLGALLSDLLTPAEVLGSAPILDIGLPLHASPEPPHGCAPEPA